MCGCRASDVFTDNLIRCAENLSVVFTAKAASHQPVNSQTPTRDGHESPPRPKCRRSLRGMASVAKGDGRKLVTINSLSALWRWRLVRIGCTDFDWRISLQAGLQFTDDIHHRVSNPGVLGADVARLSRSPSAVDGIAAG
jgi:hypothetical protein